MQTPTQLLTLTADHLKNLGLTYHSLSTIELGDESGQTTEVYTIDDSETERTVLENLFEIPNFEPIADAGEKWNMTEVKDQEIVIWTNLYGDRLTIQTTDNYLWLIHFTSGQY